MHNVPRYNEYFVLSLTVSKNNMVQMVDKPDKTPIGQDSLYPIVQLVYPAITNIFVVNQIIRYNGVFAIMKTPL